MVAELLTHIFVIFEASLHTSYQFNYRLHHKMIPISVSPPSPLIFCHLTKVSWLGLFLARSLDDSPLLCLAEFPESGYELASSSVLS